MERPITFHALRCALRRGLILAVLSSFAVLLVLSPRAALADVNARIQGTVTDPSGAVVPGVTITAKNDATGISKRVTTSPDGSYAFLSLSAPGVYTVTAEGSGFKKFTAVQVELSLNQIYVLRIQMEIGAVTQEITVKAEPAQVQTTSMQLGATITGNAIVDIPLNGRNWVDLQQTLPGVVASLGDFDRNFPTNGSRSQSNDFLINGNDSNDLPLNTPLVIPSPDAIAEVRMITSTINPEYGRNGGAIMNAVTKSGSNAFHGDAFEFYRDPFLNARNFFLPEHALFHQNQYGGTLGGPLWKNHTFFFFSYQGFKNREPIAPGRGFAGGTTTVLTQDQRNGVFPDLASSTGVSASQLVGEDGNTYPAGTPYSTLFPTGHIPTVDLNPVAMGLVNKYMPLPNFGPTEFSWNPITANNDNQYITRIDQHFGANDSIFGYWFIETETSLSDESFFGGSVPGFGESDNSKINNMNLNWSHIFSGNTLNEARVGYNRFNFPNTFPITPTQPSSVGFTGINPQLASGAGVPCIDITGLKSADAQCAFGFSVDGPQPRIDQTFQVTDNFSWIKGAHTLKFGFDMRRSAVENPFGFVNNGYYDFSAPAGFPTTTGDPAADFLLGAPDLYEQTSGGFIDARVQAYYSYAQDEWKVRPNLTVTYGLGWQINTPLKDIFNGGVAVNAFRPGQQSTVFPTAPEGLLFPGDQGINTATYHTHYHDFGPRIGFAWSPGKSGKLSIRAGFGIYYNQSEEELTLNNLSAPPFSLTDFGVSLFGLVPSFGNPYASADGSVVIPNAFPFAPPKPGDTTVDFLPYEPMRLNVMDPNLRTQAAYNYNFNIERQLPSQTILTVAYVGHQGRHLETRYELNPAGKAPGVDPACASIPGCNAFGLNSYYPDVPFRYDPNVFGSIGQQATDANSNYNSLQITLNKHTTHGLTFLATYAWSHSLDTISSFENVGGFGEPNPFNRDADYGDSSYDARQRFVFSYGYEVPSVRRFQGFSKIPGAITDGWRIAGATTFQAGFPIGLSDSSNGSFICFALVTFYGCPDRPNVLGSVTKADPRSSSYTNTVLGLGSQDHYYFDPNSFAPETPGVLGNAGRNFFHGPGINNTDLGIYKDTKITEKTKVELRFEFFNVFNHTQFNNPTGDVSSVNFGRVLSARDPRIIQLAAKFYF
ncbi:MAG TPA: carboxypeptidase regulatory-like domain-containing protein [Terriglobia bacterium]|nr:carboxypeptidase regulatory-like domain-containing protein [Terriglobia bacterium]